MDFVSKPEGTKSMLPTLRASEVVQFLRFSSKQAFKYFSLWNIQTDMFKI